MEKEARWTRGVEKKERNRTVSCDRNPGPKVFSKGQSSALETRVLETSGVLCSVGSLQVQALPFRLNYASVQVDKFIQGNISDTFGCQHKATIIHYPHIWQYQLFYLNNCQEKREEREEGGEKENILNYVRCYRKFKECEYVPCKKNNNQFKSSERASEEDEKRCILQQLFQQLSLPSSL